MEPKKWPILANARDSGLYVAGVVAHVNEVQVREVEVAIEGDHYPAVLLHQVREVVTSPVIPHIWKAEGFTGSCEV